MRMLEPISALSRLILGRRREKNLPSTPYSVLSREAYRRVVEDRVKARFGMSLPEFVEAFQAGRFQDDPTATELAVVSGASPR
jgi:hypothetical protein